MRDGPGYPIQQTIGPADITPSPMFRIADERMEGLYFPLLPEAAFLNVLIPASEDVRFMGVTSMWCAPCRFADPTLEYAE